MTDLSKVVDRETLRAAVASKMFCPVSGDALDVRSAVLVEATRKGAIVTSLIITAEVYDGKVKANIAATTAKNPGVTLTVLDGRTLFA